MFDVGWAYSPVPDIRLGFFAGYHYWHEKVTANGVVCNISLVPAAVRSTNAVPIGFDTAGAELRADLACGADRHRGQVSRSTTAGRSAARSPSFPMRGCRTRTAICCGRAWPTSGPRRTSSPKSKYAYGVETEVFVNYAVTPNIEIGAGVRYWGLASRDGDVRFGPTFAISDELNNFDQERYGVLAARQGQVLTATGACTRAHCGNAARRARSSS